MAPIALKRMLLNSMIVSLALTAFFGVLAILSELGAFGTRVTLTTMVVSGVTILGLPSAILLERGKMTVLSYAALASTVAAALLLLMTIWFEVQGDNHLRWILTLVLSSCTLSISCLIMLGSLADRFKPLQGVAVFLAATLAAQLIMAIWMEYEVSWQAFSIVALLFTTCSLAVPVLHRLSALESPQSTAAPSTPSAAKVSCPCCGNSVPHNPSGMSCGCGCKFSIQALGRDNKSS